MLSIFPCIYCQLYFLSWKGSIQVIFSIMNWITWFVMFDFVSSLYILRMNVCQTDLKKDFCPFCRSSLHSMTWLYMACVHKLIFVLISWVFLLLWSSFLYQNHWSLCSLRRHESLIRHAHLEWRALKSSRGTPKLFLWNKHLNYLLPPEHPKPQ